MRQIEREKRKAGVAKGEREGGGGEGAMYYSVIMCICILLMFLLWNHSYSNPRLRRPSHGGVAGRDGWRDDVRMERGRAKSGRRDSFNFIFALKDF